MGIVDNDKTNVPMGIVDNNKTNVSRLEALNYHVPI